MLNQKRIKQAKGRLISGKIMDLLDKRGLLNKVEHLGLKDWNGKQVMTNQLVGLSLEEQEELEKQINELVDLTL